MKNKFLLMIIICTMAMNIRVEAKEAKDFAQPTKIRCTCYTAKANAVTASGEVVREGIVSGRRSWMGKIAVIYDMDMNLIGYYEFKDTGGAKSLKNGTSIDVFQPTLDDCYEWIHTYGDYVYLQIIEGTEG